MSIHSPCKEIKKKGESEVSIFRELVLLEITKTTKIHHPQLNGIGYFFNHPLYVGIKNQCEGIVLVACMLNNIVVVVVCEMLNLKDTERMLMLK